MANTTPKNPHSCFNMVINRYQKTCVAPISLVLLLILSIPCFHIETWGESLDSKNQDIRKLLVLTGSVKAWENLADTMIESLRKQMPTVPAERWVSLRTEIDTGKLTEQAIQIYDKNLTHREVRGLIEFYESSLGSKVLRVLPQITQEMVGKGGEWAQESQRAIRKKLKKEGYALR